MEGTVRLADRKKPFKPQTVLFALEPRRGKRRHPALPGLEQTKAFGASIKRWIFEKCAQAERLTCWRPPHGTLWKMLSRGALIGACAPSVSGNGIPQTCPLEQRSPSGR